MAYIDRIDELEKKFAENERRYFAPLANEYRKVGDVVRAIEICRAWLPQQPNHISGHIVYGQALYEAGELAESRTVFEAALALDPENLIALRHLGDIATNSGDPAEARMWYMRVLEADPRNQEIAARIAEIDAGIGAAPAAPEPLELSDTSAMDDFAADLESSLGNDTGSAAAAGSGEDAAAGRDDAVSASGAPAGTGRNDPVAGGDDALLDFDDSSYEAPQAATEERESPAYGHGGESGGSEEPMVLELEPSHEFTPPGADDEPGRAEKGLIDAAFGAPQEEREVDLADVEDLDDIESLFAAPPRTADRDAPAGRPEPRLSGAIDATEATGAPVSPEDLPAEAAEPLPDLEPDGWGTAPVGEGAVEPVPLDGLETMEVGPLDSGSESPAPPQDFVSDEPDSWLDLPPEPELEAPRGRVSQPADIRALGLDHALDHADSGADAAGVDAAGVHEEPTPASGTADDEVTIVRSESAEEIRLNARTEQGSEIDDFQLAEDFSDEIDQGPSARQPWDTGTAGDDQHVESPAGFVTETMAELYVRQGFLDEALRVYQQLLGESPGDDRLEARVEEVRQQLAAQAATSAEPAQPRAARVGVSVREFFAGLVHRRGPVEDAGVVQVGADDGAEGSGERGAGVVQAYEEPLEAPPQLEVLFGTGGGSPRDEQAAATLGTLFSGDYDASPDALFEGEAYPVAVAEEPVPEEPSFAEPVAEEPATPAASGTSGDQSAPAAAAGAEAGGTPPRGAPTRAALGEFSLDRIFRPGSGGNPSVRKTGNFSFDQFFAESVKGTAPGTPERDPAGGDAPSDGTKDDDSGESEQFNSWLDGLKSR